MDSAFPSVRSEHYRLVVNYPAMFSHPSSIGEGRVTNLSVLGCTLETSHPLPERTRVLLRLILPDERESLPIEVAEVRWVKDRQLGLQFHRVARKADLRLHGFVWDRMLELLQALQNR